MNIFCKLVIFGLLVSAYSGSVSGAESEASPGALNNTEGMKQHEKEMQTTRDAIPDRGRETKMQNKTHQARNNR